MLMCMAEFDIYQQLNELLYNNTSIALLNETFSISTSVYGYSISYPASINMNQNRTIYFNFTMVELMNKI